MSSAQTAPLEGRVALVVGGAGRLGREICRILADRGAIVAVGYRGSEDAARALAAEIDGLAVRIDVNDDDAIDRAFARVEAERGSVTVVVDTAHVESHPRAVADLDREFLGEHLAAVQGFAAVARRALPGMRDAGWGRFVYVSGALMSRPYAGFSAYGAAKAAATTLTRYLAAEEGRAGVTANIVAPGRVFDPADELDETRRELSDMLLARTALGEFPTAAQIAATVADLTTSSHLTGQTVWITGGEPIIA
ncbi:beta-ketoacyl-ACP reductase [Microbacterium sediminicola]|uniref:Beta-ketoacyl-ACP reductase n=1 Tax=Microbacterium sediminicola TaxID=415210 RepID=A0ABP4U9P9_9MICO